MKNREMLKIPAHIAIDLVLLVGVFFTTYGVYLVAGKGYSSIVLGVLLIAMAILSSRVYNAADKTPKLGE